jgi:hypothetical protein
MMKSRATSVALPGYPRGKHRRIAARCAFLHSCSLIIALTGCREVRVQTFKTGTTASVGPAQLVILRDARVLHQYGINAPVRFNKEFGVLLLMGPHRETGWTQLIESIRANSERVRIVAFERGPLGGRRAGAGLPHIHVMDRPELGVPQRIGRRRRDAVG